VAVEVLGTGVLIRLATEGEAAAAERAVRGRDFVLEPPRSCTCTLPDYPIGSDEAYVVGQAFVEFVEGDAAQRWVSYEHHGHRVTLVEDATMALLAVADEVAEDIAGDLLGDMRIAALGVSRWELISAPRWIELAWELEARLRPLRRG